MKARSNDTNPSTPDNRTNSACNGCFLVDRTSTTLYQEGSIHSRIPPTPLTSREKEKDKNIDAINTNKKPAELSPFRQLYNTIKPFFLPNATQLGLRSTSILIRGPRGNSHTAYPSQYFFSNDIFLIPHSLSSSVLFYSGSGKSRLIQSVSKSLGIHFSQVNCFELLEQIESQTEENLRILLR